MSRQWNGKAFIDYMSNRLWDTSTTFRGYIIQWINEIQNDLTGEIPLDYFLFQMKKLIPTEQEIIDLSPQIPTTPTSAIAAGGSLVDGSSYQVYTTFILWDADQKFYVESEPSVATTEVTTTTGNQTINLTSIDTHDGTTTIEPQTIWRRVYLSVKASGETSYGEPFFVADIEDNTTTTLSITAESTSTITPPSDSELSQISSKHMVFNSGNRWLSRVDMNRLKRHDPRNVTSTTPSSFDYIGTRQITVYPSLSSGATTDQRTLTYYIHRRPHEIFYESSRPIDLPIEFRKALIEGIVWKAYEFRDRAGKESVQQNYEVYKRQIMNRFQRPKGAPSYIRDVSGDTRGFEI